MINNGKSNLIVVLLIRILMKRILTEFKNYNYHDFQGQHISTRDTQMWNQLGI